MSASQISSTSFSDGQFHTRSGDMSSTYPDHNPENAAKASHSADSQLHTPPGSSSEAEEQNIEKRPPITVPLRRGTTGDSYDTSATGTPFEESSLVPTVGSEDPALLVEDRGEIRDTGRNGIVSDTSGSRDVLKRSGKRVRYKHFNCLLSLLFNTRP